MFTRKYEIWLLIIIVSFREELVILNKIEDLDILFEIILSSYFSSSWLFIQKKSRLFLQKIIHICREYF